jgi:two-component system, sensor histidine kinase PdtaS
MERYAPGRAQKFIILAMMIVWAGFIALAAFWIFQSYRSTIKAAEDRVSTSSLVVATHAKWVYEFGGQATRRIADLVSSGRAPLNGNTATDIRDAMQGLPGIAKAYVVDASGRTLYSTDPALQPIDIRDREYFRVLRDGREDYVSSLLISRLNGEQILVFSRRLEENGAFAGVVTLSMSTDLMKPLWEAVDLGGDFTVSFIREDGKLVARYPKPEAGLDMSNYILFTDYLKQAPVGTYTAQASPVDGVQRLVGYRKVEGTPFIAVAAADLSLLMLPFWQNLKILGVVTALACLGSVTAALRIRGLLRVQDAQAEALQTALDKNELLLREIHHRVKNNLQSVISLVRLHLKQGERSQALSDRIQAMVTVHDLIYHHDAYAAMQADRLVRQVTEHVIKSYGTKVSVDFELEPLCVSNDRATALALLVNEVVANSLKYAFATATGGQLTVKLTALEFQDNCRLEITDNGVGFDPASVSHGTGTRLIEGSIRQLDGSYSIDGSAGTRFIAEIKLS